jgi:hypothetical protein
MTRPSQRLWKQTVKGRSTQQLDALIGLAVPGRPIRSLVAEDRSAEGVRDRTGPEPSAHEIVNATMREPAGQEGTWRDRRTVEHLLRHTTVDLWLRGEKGLERLRA